MSDYENIEYQFIFPNDWRGALDVQNASNLSGVVNSMLILISKLRQEAAAQHLSWQWLDHHPILRLFAYKINALVGQEALEFGISDDYRELEAICQRMSAVHA